MTSQKRSSCDSAHVERQFFKIKQRWAPFLTVFSGSLPKFLGILRTFSYILPWFSWCARIFRDFVQIFYISKLLGIRLHPASYTTVSKQCLRVKWCHITTQLQPICFRFRGAIRATGQTWFNLLLQKFFLISANNQETPWKTTLFKNNRIKF